MNIFDILGPVMVGPSSSHTAGAARIGYITRKLLGSQPKKARIGLSGSFAATGRGHGTDRALVAGLLGMKPDDMRIPDSFSVAKQEGLEFEIYNTQIKEAHPNTALLDVEGVDGKTIVVQASSLGGGRSRRSLRFCGEAGDAGHEFVEEPRHVHADGDLHDYAQ